MIRSNSALKWILKFILGLVIFAGILSVAGGLKNNSQLLAINWYKAWQVLLWTFTINVLTALRLNIILKPFFNEGGFLTLFKYLIIGRAIGHTTSQFIGDAGSRFAYLKSHGIELKKGAFPVFLDKILEVVLFLAIGAVFLGVIFINELGNYLHYMPVLAVFLFIAGILFLPPVIKVVERFLPVAGLSAGLKTILSGRTGFLLAALTLTKYSASAIRFMVILELSGVAISFIEVFIGTSAAQLGLIAGITPGGLGLVEAGWLSAFYGLGINSPAIPNFLVAQRVLIFSSVCIIIFVFQGYMFLRKKILSGPGQSEGR